MKFILALLVATCATVHAENTTNPKKASATTLAQRKADIHANRRKLGLVGGGFGGGRAEGVGKGRTRDSAIRHCCYWGKRKPIQIGAAKGANGWWYACVLYR